MTNSSEPIVETRLGKLRGFVQRSCVGDDFFAFKGIPYAKPPVGQLRFQDPEPAEPWTGVRDATEHGPICGQCDFISKMISGSDDCLYLNVYSKNFKSPTKLPVMVWIHGGGFMEGDGNDSWYGPDYLLLKEVVVVTINYRVGVLGFLNLENEVAPGNQGLKDQVMALKWVQDDIANFGGDSNNVTIFGESAGSGSVHYLTLSSLAKGLFHKAICQSGVVLSPWAIMDLNPKKRAHKLCELLGNKITDSKKIVEFLKTVDTLKLIEAQEKVLTKEERLQMTFPFGPGVDAKSKNPFMPVHPEEAAQNGVHVPLLIGYNNREGILFLDMAKEETKDLLPLLKSEFGKILHPNFVKIIDKYYNLKPDDLRRLYFNNDDLTQENLGTLLDLIGHMHFTESTHRVVKIQVEKSSTPTYLYHYAYDKTLSPIKTAMQTNFKGACHGDEMQHLFSMKIFEPLVGPMKKDSISYKVMETMVELWVNFATTGRPTPTLSGLVPFYWQPVSDGTVLRCLNITEDPRMHKILNIEQDYVAHKFR